MNGRKREGFDTDKKRVDFDERGADGHSEVHQGKERLELVRNLIYIYWLTGITIVVIYVWFLK